MANVSATRLEEDFWPRGYRRDVWMVLDAARDQRIFGMLLESRLEFSCLYSGVIPPALETLAPYLVQLEHEDRRSRRLLELAWGRSWGILRAANTRLVSLAKVASASEGSVGIKVVCAIVGAPASDFIKHRLHSMHLQVIEAFTKLLPCAKSQPP